MVRINIRALITMFCVIGAINNVSCGTGLGGGGFLVQVPVVAKSWSM